MASAALAGSKRPRPEDGDGGGSSAEALAVKRKASEGEGEDEVTAAVVPHSILLASGLPPELTVQMVVALFGRFPGLKDVRLIAERGLAFVEYEEHAQAAASLAALNGFNLTATSAMAVAYAKK